MTIRAMDANDWPGVRDIFLSGIATGNATFESAAPAYDDWDRSHIAFGRLVAATADSITGWAALTPVSDRCVYAGVAEVSIYVDPNHSGKGIGQQLLASLIAESEQHGIWTLQAGIFPENTASVRIHKKLGFRIVGYRERIGQMNGIWRDTLLLERRSPVVGSSATP